MDIPKIKDIYKFMNNHKIMNINRNLNIYKSMNTHKIWTFIELRIVIKRISIKPWCPLLDIRIDYSTWGVVQDYVRCLTFR